MTQWPFSTSVCTTQQADIYINPTLIPSLPIFVGFSHDLQKGNLEQPINLSTLYDFVM